MEVRVTICNNMETVRHWLGYGPSDRECDLIKAMIRAEKRVTDICDAFSLEYFFDGCFANWNGGKRIHRPWGGPPVEIRVYKEWKLLPTSCCEEALSNKEFWAIGVRYLHDKLHDAYLGY